MHSWLPEYPETVGSPRVVGIGYPGSMPFGPPGDSVGQREVLRASLEAAVGASTPGQRVDLAFEWPKDTRIPRPPKPPPITRAIMKRPWLFLNLLKGEIPGSTQGSTAT